MNNKSLLNKILFRSKLDRAKTEDVFNFIFNTISEKLKEHKTVSIDGLGEFKVRHNGIKRAVDKKRNREYILPPKDKLIFTPSDELVTKINDQK
jgi:nucleoid DNA-binding protein